MRFAVPTGGIRLTADDRSPLLPQIAGILARSVKLPTRFELAVSAAYERIFHHRGNAIEGRRTQDDKPPLPSFKWR